MRIQVRNFYIISFLFFIFTSPSIASSEEEFYVFGVGQGNAQAAFYKGENNFGVLYDCGSTSQMVHPKIDTLQNKAYQPFFQTKTSFQINKAIQDTLKDEKLFASDEE